MPRSRHSHLGPLAEDYKNAPADPSRLAALVDAIATAATERALRAGPGERERLAPGRSAAKLVQHHVPAPHRRAVLSRVREAVAARLATAPPTPAQQASALADAELVEWIVCAALELRKREGRQRIA